MGTKNPSENTEFKNVTIIKVCLLKIEIEISYCPRVILTGFTNTSYKLICFIAYFVFFYINFPVIYSNRKRSRFKQKF